MAVVVSNVRSEPSPVYTFFSIVTVLPLLPLPVTLIVLTAPFPEAVTAAPVKFKVVAAVERELPSSCTVIAPPVISIVLVAPEPEAVTAAPVKFSVVAAVDSEDPSSCTVTPPPEAAIVTCWSSFLVSVIFEPAVSCTVESVPLFASNF